LIRLNSDGTGKMAISYQFDGVRSFNWEYDGDDETISITSEVPSELRYEMQPIYMTLNVRMVNGKIAF